MEMGPRPCKVKALQNFLIYVKFNNGEEKIYDMKKILKYPFYKDLQNINNFKKIKISGINIEWETGEDIAPENLYNDSDPIEKYKTDELQEI